MNARKGLTTVLLVLALLLLALPAWAQDGPLPATTPVVGDTTITVEDGATLVINEASDTGLPPEIAGELPSRDETFKTTVIVAIALLVVLAGGALLGVFLLAYNAAPPWAQSLILSNRGWIEARVDEGTNSLVRLSRTTTNTFDDSVADYIDRTVDAKVKEWFDAREAATS